MIRKIFSHFFKSGWLAEYKVMPHKIVNDEKLAKALMHDGFAMVDFIGDKERQLLLDLYETTKVKPNEVQKQGAHIPLISKEVSEAIQIILEPALAQLFFNYKTIVHSFAPKTPGKAGKVILHQDTAAVDEAKDSHLVIWIPLHEINAENGAVHLIPRSHHIYVPFRCGTIEPLTKNIEDLLLPYFVPMYMQPGQALIFDPRVIHFSPPNLSTETRIVAACRITHKDADIVTYYRDNTEKDSPVEKWKCRDDYWQFTENHNNITRPPIGSLLQKSTYSIQFLTLEDFKAVCEKK